MKEYVVGFLFSKYEHVILIKKQKPEWQKGKWNGVGGKIEAGESPLAAMIREFKEETDIDFTDWQYSGFMEGVNNKTGDWKVHLFRGRNDDNRPPLCKVVSEGEEQAGWVGIEDIDKLQTITNLKYLVPLLYYFEGSQLASVNLKYQEFDDS